MVVIAWILLILWWFYAWLHGGWFARVLAFLVLLPVALALLVTCLGGLVMAVGGHLNDAVAVVCYIGAVPLAWFGADLPDRIRNRRVHVTASERQAQPLPSR